MAKRKSSTQAAADLTEQEQQTQMPNTQEAKQEAIQKATKVQEAMQKIILTAFNVDSMIDPESTIVNWFGVRSGHYEKWYTAHFESAAKRVAAQFGVDTKQVVNAETRTPEQQQALLMEWGKEKESRMQLYFKSKHFQALKTLENIEGKYHSKHEGEPGHIDLKEQAILYFFALHSLTEINPTDTDPLTDAQKMELIDLFYRLDKFYLEEANKNKDDESPEPVTLYRFIEAENPNTNLPVIITKKIQEIAYPLDKVNSSFWGLIPGEQATLKAESDRDSRKGKEANIYVLLDFDEMKGTGVTISRPLTSYDKRVFIAAANLKEQGHDTVTTAQIYEAMGNKGRPATSQRQKILRSIETMSLCRVTLDNSEEAAMYTSYDKVKRTFYLLPTTIDKGYVNGLIVDDAITIIELPRLFIFAKKRKQFASTTVALLESPLSQTEANLQLEDYLLTRISRMKNAKKRKKPITTTILLDTVYKNCYINNKHQRSRAPEKIERLLQHYQKQGYIKGYKLTAKSIDIDL